MAKSKPAIKVNTKSKVRSKNAPRPGAMAGKAGVKPAKFNKMVVADLKKYKAILIERRAQVGGDLSHIAQNTLNKSARDASGDLSGYSFHMADQASDDYERDFSLGRATAEQKILYLIDEAIKRIDDGMYGSCLACGGQIARKRLAALPYSELCIECQKKNENK